ncbi:MAG: disulfide bond formation protein B [Rhodocyclaceae bacterium]|nr:disulfide bond formation protein B [Rhodocyclaceae bacterium]
MNPIPFLLHSSHRTRYWLLFAFCVALEIAGLFMQHGLHLNPCPMCILQRYAFLFVGLAALAGALHTQYGQPGRGALAFWWALALVFCLAGLGVAAWQSWIQWYPPSISTCGPDAFDLIGELPFSEILPMMFQGTGSCEVVEWSLFGLSIANYSFLAFCAIAPFAVWGIVRALRRQ